MTDAGPSSRRTKVSVCMTTYNHEPFVAQAIESVLMQVADFPYEIVIGDDCSTDGTREIVAGYATERPGCIRVLTHSENLGAAGRANLAAVLEAASGEYIAVLEGDDYWTDSEKLQVQAGFLDSHAECSLCFHNVQMVESGTGRPQGTIAPPHNRQYYGLEDILRYHFIHSSSILFRRFSGPLPAWFLDVEPRDWSLYVLNAERGHLGWIDRTMSVWRIHPGGQWSSAPRICNLERQVRFYGAMAGHVASPWSALAARLQAQQQFSLALEQYLLGQQELALSLVAAATKGHTQLDDSWRGEVLNQASGLEDRGSADARDLLGWVCQTLAPAPFAATWTRRLMGAWHVAQAFRAHRRGDLKSVRRAAVQALVTDWRVMRNRGFVSLLVKAWMGERIWEQVHRVATRLQGIRTAYR